MPLEEAVRYLLQIVARVDAGEDALRAPMITDGWPLVGSTRGLAGADEALTALKRHLLEGGIGVIERVVLPDGGIEIKSQTEEDLIRLERDGAFDFWRSFNSRAGRNIFLRRFHVYRIWMYSNRQERETFPEAYGDPVPPRRPGETVLEAFTARLNGAARRAAYDAVLGDPGSLFYRGWPGTVHEAAQQTVQQLANQAAPPAALPAKRPKGVGVKLWRVIRIVLDLRRGEHRDSKQPALLDAVNKILAIESASLANIETTSLGTVKKAIAWLRENGFIDH
jgi:hypothetical protein